MAPPSTGPVKQRSGRLEADSGLALTSVDTWPLLPKDSGRVNVSNNGLGWVLLLPCPFLCSKVLFPLKAPNRSASFWDLQGSLLADRAGTQPRHCACSQDFLGVSHSTLPPLLPPPPIPSFLTASQVLWE